MASTIYPRGAGGRFAPGGVGSGGVGQVSFSWEPTLELLISDLQGFAATLDDFHEALEACVEEVMIPSLTTNFDVGGRPAWEPLKESTIERKQGFERPEAPLIRTGDLMEKVGSIDAWNIEAMSATFTNLDGVEYGWAHNEGYYSPRSGDVPQRQFLTFQDEDETRIAGIFGRFIAAKQAAFAL